MKDNGERAEMQHRDQAGKARLPAEKVAREKLEEANREDKMHIHQSHEESKND
jgi:hypothetical protein